VGRRKFTPGRTVRVPIYLSRYERKMLEQIVTQEHFTSFAEAFRKMLVEKHGQVFPAVTTLTGDKAE